MRMVGLVLGVVVRVVIIIVILLRLLAAVAMTSTVSSAPVHVVEAGGGATAPRESLARGRAQAKRPVVQIPRQDGTQAAREQGGRQGRGQEASRDADRCRGRCRGQRTADGHRRAADRRGGAAGRDVGRIPRAGRNRHLGPRLGGCLTAKQPQELAEEALTRARERIPRRGGRGRRGQRPGHIAIGHQRRLVQDGDVPRQVARMAGPEKQGQLGRLDQGSPIQLPPNGPADGRPLQPRQRNVLIAPGRQVQAARGQEIGEAGRRPGHPGGAEPDGRPARGQTRQLAEGLAEGQTHITQAEGGGRGVGRADGRIGPSRQIGPRPGAEAGSQAGMLLAGLVHGPQGGQDDPALEGMREAVARRRAQIQARVRRDGHRFLEQPGPGGWQARQLQEDPGQKARHGRQPVVRPGQEGRMLGRALGILHATGHRVGSQLPEEEGPDGQSRPGPGQVRRQGGRSLLRVEESHAETRIAPLPQRPTQGRRGPEDRHLRVIGLRVVCMVLQGRRHGRTPGTRQMVLPQCGGAPEQGGGAGFRRVGQAAQGRRPGGPHGTADNRGAGPRANRQQGRLVEGRPGEAHHGRASKSRLATRIDGCLALGDGQAGTHGQAAAAEARAIQRGQMLPGRREGQRAGGRRNGRHRQCGIRQDDVGRGQQPQGRQLSAIPAQASGPRRWGATAIATGPRKAAPLARSQGAGQQEGVHIRANDHLQDGDARAEGGPGGGHVGSRAAGEPGPGGRGGRHDGRPHEDPINHIGTGGPQPADAQGLPVDRVTRVAGPTGTARGHGAGRLDQQRRQRHLDEFVERRHGHASRGQVPATGGRRGEGAERSQGVLRGETRAGRRHGRPHARHHGQLGDKAQVPRMAAAQSPGWQGGRRQGRPDEGTERRHPADPVQAEHRGRQDGQNRLARGHRRAEDRQPGTILGRAGLPTSQGRGPAGGGQHGGAPGPRGGGLLGIRTQGNRMHESRHDGCGSVGGRSPSPGDIGRVGRSLGGRLLLRQE
ncbi:hypothetical protein H696_03408 [Fonticula alba]|uniref:Uncharacterized protein n=1 Tax=Fonticula alba TaxID=691883 RepID=A0A058Z7Q1_FONAL|nr:hypothetical protein H696_03408 [Fonticula alba]KCV69943.1 hypothetical protein H696_03408 [Fonticula alba]|eukprot:XP_009495549.1 hypothetical protein H696_03408 [Fonticula alba]